MAGKAEEAKTIGVLSLDYDVITSWEVFEHLLNPHTVLHNLKGKLLCTVPLNVWFAKPYWLYRRWLQA